MRTIYIIYIYIYNEIVLSSSTYLSPCGRLGQLPSAQVREVVPAGHGSMDRTDCCKATVRVGLGWEFWDFVFFLGGKGSEMI